MVILWKTRRLWRNYGKPVEKLWKARGKLRSLSPAIFHHTIKLSFFTLLYVHLRSLPHPYHNFTHILTTISRTIWVYHNIAKLEIAVTVYFCFDKNSDPTEFLLRSYVCLLKASEIIPSVLIADLRRFTLFTFGKRRLLSESL